MQCSVVILVLHFSGNLEALISIPKSLIRHPSPWANLNHMIKRNVYWRAVTKEQDGCPSRAKYAQHNYDVEFLSLLEDIQSQRRAGIETSKVVQQTAAGQDKHAAF